jgi:hypothetical protein
MQLICPECETSKTREALSWRLELCPSCAENGHEVYLVGTSRSATPPAAPARELSATVRRFLGTPGGPAPLH